MTIRSMNRRQALAALGQLTATIAAAAPDVAGKRILWVDSYHEGNPWNDGIGRGITATLKGQGVELRILRMDTARHPDEAFARQAAQRAKTAVDDFKPDVVIATDDAAAKYFVVPYLKGGPLPVVFAGINWDASAYGFPTSTITGMLEVDLVRPLVRALREYTRGDRVAYLSADTQTQAKVVATYNQHFFGGQMQVRLVRTVEEFQRAYLETQTMADMLITGNYAGIAGWDDAAARSFIMDRTRIPTGYVDGYMTPLVLITMGKLPEEQGEYAADTALKILRGARPGNLPLAENKKAVLGLNLALADKLGIVFSPALLKNAGIVHRG
ncbi:ABC transporter substrate binding protein [Piscinibacter sp. XHJ-5]|uniref:ABC transporter substrate-binding protein n=1 Tax=Piscinibacter sp. XHJ-5 TaxID=3037797 RepID=UPI00245304E8|nr:ABC transporter substrate binding protein [Piscinibacter sp. XHJ-5]